MIDRSKVLADYHQVFLVPTGKSPILDPAQPMTLVQVADEGKSLIILTGIAAGPIWLSVRTGPAPAPSPEYGEGGWEERQDVVLNITDELFVIEPTEMDAGIPGAVFAPAAPGAHRVTVLARGRNTHYDEALDPDGEPTEEYLVRISRE